MGELRKVWVVRHDYYDNWGVLAVFERQEDAEAAIAAGLGADADGYVYAEAYDVVPAGRVPEYHPDLRRVPLGKPSEFYRSAADQAEGTER